MEAADGALTEFTATVLEDQTPQIESAALKQAKSFWTDVWAGVVGAFG